jgi:hypothetical protein
VDSDSVNKKLNCRLIHISDKMTADETLTDKELNFTSTRKSVILRRNVEILQWRESKHKEQDFTYYTYSLDWVEHDVDSSGFHEKGYDNPPRAVPVFSKTFLVGAHVGAYRLSRPCMNRLKRWHVAELTADKAAALAPLFRCPPEESKTSFAGLREGTRDTRIEGQVQRRGESYWSSIMDEHKQLPRHFAYLSHVPPPLVMGPWGTPIVPAPAPTFFGYGSMGSLGVAGDMRLSYDEILEGDVSVVGVLQGDSFRAFNEADAHTVSAACRGALTLARWRLLIRPIAPQVSGKVEARSVEEGGGEENEVPGEEM